MSQGQNDGSGNKNSYSGEGNIIDWYVQKTHYEEEKNVNQPLKNGQTEKSRALSAKRLVIINCYDPSQEQ